jgi:hypothetical protein
MDGQSAFYIEAVVGVEAFLGRRRSALRDRSFRPLPVRERMIPKAGGKKRRLGIATITDRVVQASLKLVLEPVFEADFLPCSYGFRLNRRAHDAVAEVRYLASRPREYEWVVEGDIKACFDEISHVALQERVRARVGDKRVLALVKAFLKAGILTEAGALEDTSAGTPQGSLCSVEHNPPWGVPSSVGANPFPASKIPAFSHLAIIALAGKPPSISSRCSWPILSNAPARSASRIHTRSDFPRRVLNKDSIASWQPRPGRNPYDRGSNRASHSGSSALRTRA